MEYYCRANRCKGLRSIEIRIKIDYQCGDCGITKWKKEWSKRMKILREADASVTRALTAVTTMYPPIHDAAAIQARWNELKSRDRVRDMLKKEKKEKLKIMAEQFPRRESGGIVKRRPPYPKNKGHGKSPLANIMT